MKGPVAGLEWSRGKVVADKIGQLLGGGKVDYVGPSRLGFRIMWVRREGVGAEEWLDLP